MESPHTRTCPAGRASQPASSQDSPRGWRPCRSSRWRCRGEPAARAIAASKSSRSRRPASRIASRGGPCRSGGPSRRGRSPLLRDEGLPRARHLLSPVRGHAGSPAMRLQETDRMKGALEVRPRRRMEAIVAGRRDRAVHGVPDDLYQPPPRLRRGSVVRRRERGPTCGSTHRWSGPFETPSRLLPKTPVKRHELVRAPPRAVCRMLARDDSGGRGA